MRIKQISVNGLFGIFDHVIPLNTEERITIIHGLNGFGKTNILRILNGIFNSQYSPLRAIPFNEFIVEFDDDTTLKVEKKIGNVESKDSIRRKHKLLLHLNQPNLEPLFVNLSSKKPSDNDKIYNLLLEDCIPGIEKVEIQTWKYKPTGETLSFDEIIERFGSDIPNELTNRFVRLEEDPDRLKELKHKLNIRLIESQRLLNIDFSSSPIYGDETSSNILSTVSTYSQELAALMRDKFTEYGKISQSLDRTFPIRAVQQKEINLTDEELREELDNLEKMRSRLIKLGLLDQEENPDFITQLQNIDESARNILSVYINDIKQKLSIFNEIADKIELLKTIINRKFAYSFKKLDFSKEKGFIFTSCYPNFSEEYSKIFSPTDLSSGEQHELVLLSELLFKVEPGSLVLIDEPELSLHVGWQSEFLKDLKAITKLADLDILIATHSPDIIQEHWNDLTVKLKAPSK